MSKHTLCESNIIFLINKIKQLKYFKGGCGKNRGQLNILGLRSLQLKNIDVIEPELCIILLNII